MRLRFVRLPMKANSIPFFSSVLIALIEISTLCGSRSADAQVDPNIEMGLHPYGTFSGSDIDTVSLTNGSLTVNIPLFTIPQRGKLQTTVKIRYGSKTWRVYPGCPNATRPGQDYVCKPFWYNYSTTGPGVILDDGMPDAGVTATQGPQGYRYNGGTPDGGIHELTAAPNGGFVSLDGSGIRCPNCSANNATQNPIAYSRDGRKSDTAASTVTDSNGNSVNYSGTDSMGRPSPLPPVNGTSADTSGCTQAATQATIISYPGPNEGANGSSRKVKTCLKTISIHTAFHATLLADKYGNNDPIAEANQPAASAVDRIILYDGLDWTKSPSWTFDYDSAGELSGMTLPTGAAYGYGWTPMGQQCSVNQTTPKSMWVTQRNDPASGATIYSYDGTSTTETNSGTIEHDFDNLEGSPVGQTICGGYETKTKWFLPGATVPAKEVDTAYQHINGLDSTAQFTIAKNVLPITKTTYLDGVAQGRVETVYDSALGSGVSYGIPLQKREYDYVGPTASTTVPIRCTETMHQAFKSGSYLSANMVDLPSATAVYAGNCPDAATANTPTGSPITETLYGYDVGTVTPWNAQAAQAAFGVRGNQTSVSQVQTNPPGPTITTTTSYFDTGMPYQTKDAIQTTSTFSYDPAYAGAYLTGTTLPTVNGISQTRSALYDFNTGQVTSVTDANSQTSTFTYDGLGRLWLAQYADTPASGASKALCYPDLNTVIEYTAQSSPLPLWGASSQDCSVFTGSSMRSTIHTFDGLGRTSSVAQKETSASSIIVDTKYDGQGNIASVPIPTEPVRRVTQQRHSYTTPYTGKSLRLVVPTVA